MIGLRIREIMIAKRIPSILPMPDMNEFLEILNIYSAGGNSLIKEGRALSRPVRTPHHTISGVGLLGGGAIPGRERFRWLITVSFS